MQPFFLILFSLLITQRLGELALASKNGRWMGERGGYEVGRSHYKYLVLIHVGFLLSLLSEVFAGSASVPSWWAVPFAAFLAAQGLRYWCILSLGPFWNTRIYILPDSQLVKKGPYRWLRHPNYLVVMIELAVFPLIFGAYYTALIWSAVNFCFLKMVRIPLEEKALQQIQEVSIAYNEGSADME